MPYDDTDTMPVPGATRGIPSNSGVLTIHVPSEAKVFINGLETKSTGTRREYVSHDLKPGLRYKYEIRAVVRRDGRQVEDVQVAYLTSGATEAVALDFQRQRTEQVAKVW